MITHVLSMIDGNTEELLDAIELRHFDLQRFMKQFDVCEKSDPQMLDRYAVGPGDVNFLCRELGQDLTFNFSEIAYFIEAVEKDIV